MSNHHADDHDHDDDHPGPLWLAACAVGLVVGWGCESRQIPYFQVPYLAALWAGGLPGLMKQALTRRPDIHSLMGFAVLAAVALGHWAEGAFLLLLFEGAEELEHHASERSEEALRQLLDRRAATARRVEADGLVEVGVEALTVGDLIDIRAGELVPIDGQIESGSASVDLSSLRGESVPQFFETGQAICSGSQLLEGSLRVRCSCAASESTLARAADLIYAARQQKLQVQSDIERWMDVYSMILPVVALVFGVAAFATKNLNATEAVYRALTLLVVGSPCALVLAAPSVFLTGLVQAARGRVLIKGSRYLERLATMKNIAFDKTGTLTTGEFQLVEVHSEESDGNTNWLTWLASLESRSSHPLGQSLVRAAQEQKLDLYEVEEFWSHQGRGVTGIVQGRRFYAGRLLFLQESGVTVEEQWCQKALEWQKSGDTVIWAAQVTDSTPPAAPQLAIFRLRDRLRPQALQAVRSLQSLGVKPFILTGDGHAVAASVARSVGIEKFQAELLPEDKVEAVRLAQPTIMVGDGVNDAPALATAGVGIALGASGSQLAIESSDVVLTHTDLNALPELIGLARRCRRLVLQNFTLALGTIVTLAVCVVLGKVSLATGVLGHEGSTILVVLNGLRLLRTQRAPSAG